MFDLIVVELYIETHQKHLGEIICIKKDENIHQVKKMCDK